MRERLRSLFPRRADKIRVGMNVDRQNTNGSTWCGRHVPALDRMSGGVWGWWWVHIGRARHERSTHAHSEERARSDARAARRIVRNFTSLHMPRSLLAIVTFAVLCSPPPRSVRGDLLPARPLLPRPPHSSSYSLARKRHGISLREEHRWLDPQTRGVLEGPAGRRALRLTLTS